MDALTLALTIVGSILGGGTVGALISAFAMRKKTAADADATTAKIILSYSDKLSADNDKFRIEITKLEGDLDAAYDRLEKMKSDLEKSETNAKALKDLVTNLEARKANDRVIITKLISALKGYDPDNHLIMELQQLSDFHIDPPSK